MHDIFSFFSSIYYLLSLLLLVRRFSLPPACVCVWCRASLHTIPIPTLLLASPQVSKLDTETLLSPPPPPAYPSASLSYIPGSPPPPSSFSSLLPLNSAAHPSALRGSFFIKLLWVRRLAKSFSPTDNFDFIDCSILTNSSHVSSNSSPSVQWLRITFKTSFEGIVHLPSLFCCCYCFASTTLPVLATLAYLFSYIASNSNLSQHCQR